MRRWRVRINVDRLRQNLSREDRTPYDLAHVRRWLEDSGFTPAGGDEWLVIEHVLGQLKPEEVIELNPADDEA